MDGCRERGGGVVRKEKIEGTAGGSMLKEKGKEAQSGVRSDQGAAQPGLNGKRREQKVQWHSAKPGGQRCPGMGTLLRKCPTLVPFNLGVGGC